MTTVNNTTSGAQSTSFSNETTNANTKKSFLQKYVDSTPSKELDTKTMFKKLSIDVGSDGKTITKDKLDAYVTKAENKEIKISDDELKGLKTMQEKWDTLALGGDKITNSNMSNNKDILKSMAGKTKETPDFNLKEEKQASKDKINNYLAESAFNTSFNIQNGSSDKSNLKSMLKTLLSGTTDEQDDANAELISSLTNLIESSKKNSTVELEA